MAFPLSLRLHRPRLVNLLGLRQDCRSRVVCGLLLQWFRMCLALYLHPSGRNYFVVAKIKGVAVTTPH